MIFKLVKLSEMQANKAFKKGRTIARYTFDGAGLECIWLAG